MTAYLLTDHLLNLVAPAAVVALILVLLASFFGQFSGAKNPVAQSIWARAAIIFIVNLVVLVAGLVLFGNDGRMATYAVLVLAAATCQWLLGKRRK
jgi:Ni,Fe-hydrogenase I cytochrome b subunit